MERNGYFEITSVHRDDLEAAGFDSSNVSDETMELLAKKMANDYLEQLYWTSLSIIAEDCLGIPKKVEKESTECGDNAICLELSDGKEVELRDTWLIEDGDSYDVVEVIDTETNHVIGRYRGHLPDPDEDYDIDKLIEKVEEAIYYFKS